MSFEYIETFTKTIKLNNDSKIPEEYGDTLLDLKVSIQAGTQKDFFMFQDSKIITFYKGIPNKNLEILVTAKSFINDIEPIINIYGTFGIKKQKIKIRKTNYLESFLNLFR